MKITTIYHSSHFKKSVKKHKDKRRKIEVKIKQFQKNPFDKRLETHKLSGKLSSYWSFSIDYNLRILLEFTNKNTVSFIDIGTHEIYK